MAKKGSISQKHRNFNSLCRHLKDNLPIDYPVSVRRTTLPTDRDGDCRLYRKKFYVRVERSLAEDSAMSILIHEMSHCISWHKEKEDHDTAWGRAYSLTYREFLRWNDAENELY